MNRFKYALLLLSILYSCQNTVKVNTTKAEVEKKDTIPINAIEVDSMALIESLMKIDSAKTYVAIKREIKQIQSEISQKPLSKDSLARLFTKLLVKQIIPYWYGTDWSFEGHTSIPNEGQIACGYFVSTTLKHLGLNLNRYHLAQQLPMHEAMSLQLDSNILIISNPSAKENLAEIKKQLEDGIYFIGFAQSHVGFLYKTKQEVYLIHANFWGTNIVLIEKAVNSTVFSYFNELYIAALSSNEALIQRWLKNEKIDIIKG